MTRIHTPLPPSLSLNVSPSLSLSQSLPLNTVDGLSGLDSAGNEGVSETIVEVEVIQFETGYEPHQDEADYE